MKILVITTPKQTGLTYHRQLVPFKHLGIPYDIQTQYKIDWEDDFLKQYDCVSFLRLIDENGRSTQIIERLHKLGIKVHFDIDDYWVLPPTHPMSILYKEKNVTQQVIDCLKNVDFITTTTPYLADKIKEHNSNVHVLPNCLDYTEEQWQPRLFEHPRVHIGYIAAVHHADDLRMLYPNIVKLWNDRGVHDKWQLCPAGFSLQDGKINGYYQFVEKIFTGDYKYVTGDYKKYLKEMTPEANELIGHDKRYMRLWAQDVYNYGRLYDWVDVCLAPLVYSDFAICKSELKMVEAGMKKKSIIVSDIQPYNLLITDKNCLSVKPSRNLIDFHTAMRRLILNKNLRDDLSEQLHLDVKERYDLDKISIERKQIFEANVI